MRFLASSLETEAGISPRQATYFLACQKVGKEHRPYCPRPSGFAYGQPAPTTSCGCTAKLTARLQRFVQTRCRKSDDDAVALCGATARHKRPPSQAWAQGAIPGGLQRDWPQADFVTTHTGRPLPPVWLRLRHAVQAAGIGTEECQCIVIKFAATCLNEAACRAVSFAAPQPELRDAGLPGAKRRDADTRVVFFCLLCLHEQEKKVACRGETRPPHQKQITTLK